MLYDLANQCSPSNQSSGHSNCYATAKAAHSHCLQLIPNSFTSTRCPASTSAYHTPTPRRGEKPFCFHVELVPSKSKPTFKHSTSMVSVKTCREGPQYCKFPFSWQMFPVRDRVGCCQTSAKAQPLKTEKEFLKKVLFFGLWCSRAPQRIYMQDTKKH